METRSLQNKHIKDGNEQSEQGNMIDTLKWWNHVRWLSTISFLSIGIIQMALRDVSFPKLSFILILTAITLLNFMYSFWLQHSKHIRIYPFIHNFLDMLIFTFAIYITGGKASPLIWSYLIPILTSSITIGRMAGFVASLTSLLGLFTVLLLGDHQDLFHQAGLLDYLKNISEINISMLFSYACLFFLVYFISSFLANTLRAQNKTLVKLNHLLKQKNQQIVASQDKLLQMERKALVDNMARTIQHELNNPMAVLSLNVELLIKEQDERLQKRLKPIWSAVLRMRKTLGKIEKLYSLHYRDVLGNIKILDIHKPTGVHLDKND
ncbi:MAG: HAMP domain-containing histidine kinase [Calditrichaeota bacterium]|nr:HAMP domain-containing histidine kinase [Calditrichota bacterium]